MIVPPELEEVVLVVAVVVDVFVVEVVVEVVAEVLVVVVVVAVPLQPTRANAIITASAMKRTEYLTFNKLILLYTLH